MIPFLTTMPTSITAPIIEETFSVWWNVHRHNHEQPYEQKALRGAFRGLVFSRKSPVVASLHRNFTEGHFHILRDSIRRATFKVRGDCNFPDQMLVIDFAWDIFPRKIRDVLERDHTPTRSPERNMLERFEVHILLRITEVHRDGNLLLDFFDGRRLISG